MAKKKFISKEEFEGVIKENEPWKVLELPHNGLPDSIAGIPKEKVAYICASGSVNPTISSQGEVIAGIDIYRIAEAEDGFNYNKDHYNVVLCSTASFGMFALIGPLRPDDHWTDNLPSSDNVELAWMRPKKK